VSVEELPESRDFAAEIDVTRPHTARMYDYYLGGKNHFAADRELAEKTLAVVPTARTVARENRAFLGRAVRFLAAEAGISQFLDIGTGLPTANSVHEVAQAAVPTAHVVYVDNDPLVLAHARALLTSAPQGRTAYIHADLREPGAILADPVVRDVLDFREPVALMLVAILHFIADEDKPGQIISTLLDALPAGSYLVASHISDEHSEGNYAAGQSTYRSSGLTAKARHSSDFARLAFAGLDLVPPGVVATSDWRPEDDGPRPSPAEAGMYAGVARKP
jgi:hypothetical protein